MEKSATIHEKKLRDVGREIRVVENIFQLKAQSCSIVLKLVHCTCS